MIDVLKAAKLRQATRIDWGQPLGDVPVDRWFGVVSTPGPLCNDLDVMGEQACTHTSCGAILWPTRYVMAMP